MAFTQQSRIPGGARVYVIGDIHGRADLLADMHGRIAADAAEGSPERKVLVYLGDYVDRGPHSFQVIGMLTAKPLEGFEAVFLKGNHEDMLLSFLEGGVFGDAWLLNGGVETLGSYGVYIDGAAADAEELRAARREFRQAPPPSHLDFLQGLSLSHAEGDYFFAHAGVNPGAPLENQREVDLLWIREDFLNYRGPFAKIVVHGHTIYTSPCVRPNRIGIDTGAYKSGCLTCLVLEGEDRRFLQT